MLNLVIYESDFDKINYNMLQVLDYIIAKVYCYTKIHYNNKINDKNI